MKEIHDHSFNVNVAAAIGHEKAILLKELYYWCQHNFNNQRNFHYGLYWTYNTAEAFALKFPYFSRRSIARWLQQLEQEGYIGSLLLNKKGYDRTKWYCVNEGAYVTMCNGSTPGSSLDQFKKYITNLTNSIGQNGQTNGQNGESFSQNGQPIPPLNHSNKPTNKQTTFGENEFSTVLVDCEEDLVVEIHHVPDYFDTEIKKERKSSAKKKESDDPAPIRAMFELYADKYAELNSGVKPEFMVKYTPAMKNLYGILRARSITTGFVPMYNLEPWRDFLTAWADYLAKNEKEKWHRANFNPLTFFSQFNSIIAMLNNRPKTDAEKWVEWGKRQGL